MNEFLKKVLERFGFVFLIFGLSLIAIFAAIFITWLLFMIILWKGAEWAIIVAFALYVLIIILFED